MENPTNNDLPWEKLGISRRAYFYNKAKVQDEIALSANEIVFNGTNGNLCKQITRAQMEAVLKRNPEAFVPNWFRAGLPTRTFRVS